MISDQTLKDILNADEYSLRHYDTEICEAIEELQAYRRAMYDARKQAHLFDSPLGLLMNIRFMVQGYYEEGIPE